MISDIRAVWHLEKILRIHFDQTIHDFEHFYEVSGRPAKDSKGWLNLLLIAHYTQNILKYVLIAKVLAQAEAQYD